MKLPELAKTAATMETYVQDPPSSCMSCHQGVNARGFDFVGTLASLR